MVEGEYRTGRQEHVYIEPQGVIAVPGDGGVTVYGSLQCPYYVHKALVALLALPHEKVRIVQTETGGGFGGKEDYPSIIAGHAALLALKSGGRSSSSTTGSRTWRPPRSATPSIVRHRTGVARDGRIIAMEIDVLLDGGAYCTLSPVVLSRGCLHATGPYRCDERAHPRPRGGDQHAAQRRLPRLRRAADRLRGRGADRPRGGGARPRPGAAPRSGTCCGPGDTMATGQKLGEDASALAGAA